MFHAGHVSILRQAQSLGDYLLVGVFNDGILNSHRGSNHPIMNLNERVLSVLSCRWVDDVVIDPPWCVTEEMIKALGISVVVNGTTTETGLRSEERDFRGALDLGIYKKLQSESNLTVATILDRIEDNRSRLQNKFDKKNKAEALLYKEKHGLKQYHGV